MSAITIENDLVHYEVLGRGRPVIFVHGWLGSWRYWVPTMQQLSMKYRTYALDLWGFGDSGKQVNRYGFKDQVKLLYDFMDKLGIAKAALVGHSLGAAICLRFASQYPDRVPRAMLVSTPLFDLGSFEEILGAAPIPAPAPAAPAPGAGAPGAPAPTPVTAAPPAPAAPTAPVSAPTSTAAAPVTPATPAPAATGAAPAAAPAPAATSATAAPAPQAPATAATGPATPPTAPVPQPVTPATPAPAATSPAPTPAAPATQPAPGTTLSATDTQPRNPFHGLGDTPEEILSRLQAKNIATSAAGGVNPPGQASSPAPATLPQTKPLPPSAPALPVSIGTPILPKTAPLAPPVEPGTTGSVPTPAPATAIPRSELPNPLITILSGIKPGALLVKHVDRDAPDLDKLRAEVEKTDEAALTKSAQSFTGVNLAAELHRLPSATLLLHGKDDPLLPAPPDDLIRRINQGKPEGHFLAFIEPGLRHFPMLEITAKFNRLLVDFLDAQDLTNVQFKDQWIRIFR